MISQNKMILALVLVVSSIIVSGVTQPQIFAEETDEKQYTSANEITIHTVFGFRAGMEKSDSFQVFEQTSGFNRDSESPTFRVEGVIGSDRTYLYEAADMTFKRGIFDSNHMYRQFDADVYLQKDGITLRHFKYIDCSITDYKVTTLFDKEEGWTTSKGFAIVDEFEFGCNGYQPNNPLFDLMESDGYEDNTQNSMDLKDTQTWSDSYK